MAIKRRRNPKGQLQPLSARLSAHQAAMRQDRREWRSGLAMRMGSISFVLQRFLTRGFFGRLKWLLVGR